MQLRVVNKKVSTWGKRATFRLKIVVIAVHGVVRGVDGPPSRRHHREEYGGGASSSSSLLNSTRVNAINSLIAEHFANVESGHGMHVRPVWSFYPTTPISNQHTRSLVLILRPREIDAGPSSVVMD